MFAVDNKSNNRFRSNARMGISNTILPDIEIDDRPAGGSTREYKGRRVAIDIAFGSSRENAVAETKCSSKAARTK
jgi:hypothetical protein